MDPTPPSNESWSVPASSRVEGRRGLLRAIVVWTLRIVGTLLAMTIGVVGMTRTRSLDLPLPHETRVGLFGNDRPMRWTCNEGHDHWSIPYWMGSVVIAAPTLGAWLVATRKGRR